MESSTLNEEELLSRQLKMLVDEYFLLFGNEEKRQDLLQFLQINDCRELISKCFDGDSLSNAFVLGGGRKHLDILQAFLDHGMNVDTKNHHGWTALMYASSYDSKEIVQLLFDHNANIDLKNNIGKSAIDLAKTDKIKEMIQNHVTTSYVLK